MKRPYIIFGIITLSIITIYFGIKKEFQNSTEKEKPSKKYKKMEIKKADIFQSIDNEEILNILMDEYYPVYDDENFDQLDEVSQTFVLIMEANGQINNGGITQFIDNGTGNRFHETIEAAEKINSKILVEILTRASKQFPKGRIPKDWEERRNLYEELCDKYLTFKTFDELTPEEKEVVLNNRKKYKDTTPLDQCKFEEENNWSKTWDELDSLYYENSELIIKSLIEYLRNNATIVE